MQDLVVQENVVIGAENFAEHEVRKGENIQRDRDEVGDIAAEFFGDDAGDVEHHQRARALKDVVDGDVDAPRVVDEIHDERRDRREQRAYLQDDVDDVGAAPSPAHLFEQFVVFLPALCLFFFFHIFPPAGAKRPPLLFYPFSALSSTCFPKKTHFVPQTTQNEKNAKSPLLSP